MCWGHIVTFLWALTAVIRAQVPVHAPKVVPKGVPQPPTPHWGWDIDQGVRLAPLGAHLDVQPSLAPHGAWGRLGGGAERALGEGGASPRGRA